MKKLITCTILSTSLLLAANTNNTEISILLGGVYTEGNIDLKRDYVDAGLSIATDLNDSYFEQIEIGFLRSVKDVDFRSNNDNTSVTRIFVNGLKYYDLNKSSSIYALLGAGLESFNNEARNESGLFANYGFGYKYKISDTTSFKFDLRHALETDHGDNNLLYTAGLTFAFGKSSNDKIVEEIKEVKKVVEEKKEEVKEEKVVLLDDDKDGIYNRYDKCLNSPTNANVDLNGCTKSVDLKVNFKSDSDEMNEDYSNLLKQFSNFLKDTNNKAKIEAYTDSRGSSTYNQKLSQKRANKVYNELINLGVKKENLEAIGQGEKDPIASNMNKEGRAENRRVKVTILK